MTLRYLLSVLVVLFLACGGGPAEHPPTPDKLPELQAIPPAVSGPLAGSLATAAGSLAAQGPQNALAAQTAAVAIQAGVGSNAVTLTASLVAGPRSALTSGAAQAFGFQLRVLNLAGTTSPQTYSGVLVFQDAANWVLVAGPSSGSPIPPGVGTLEAGGEIWRATAGQESAQLQAEGSACPVAGLPAGVTSCKLATFSSAGFSITSATPSSAGATGSKAASLPNGALSAGVSLILDCNLSALCPGGSSSGIRVAVTPAPVMVQANAVQQFAAVVTGTTNQAVTWSVDEANGGSITSTGRYTAPGSPGQYHVRATSQQDPSKSGFSTVTVPSPTVTVSVSLSQPSVTTLGTVSLTAQVTGTANTAVLWSVDENSSAHGEFPAGKVTSTGPNTANYVAPPSTGTYNVRATSQSTGVSGAATVTVTAGCMVALPSILPVQGWFIASPWTVPLRFDPQGRLLAAWLEFDEFGGSLNTKAFVGRLENGLWTRLGSSGISLGEFGPFYIALELDSLGAPVLAYELYNNTSSQAEIHVTKWNGNSWVDYPSTISSLIINTPFAMTLGAQSVPVLAVPRTLPSAPFRDLAIEKWSGSSWAVTPGIELNAGATVFNPSILADAAGDVFATWDEQGLNGNMVVYSHVAKKLTGPGAGLLGQPGNGADSRTAQPVLAFDASGALVMGWSNYPDGTLSAFSDGFEVSVLGATSWSQVGTSLPGLSGVVVPERNIDLPHPLVLNAHTGRLAAATLSTTAETLGAYGEDQNGAWPLLCAPLQEPVTPGPLGRPLGVGLTYDPTAQDFVLAGARFDRILLAHVH